MRKPFWLAVAAYVVPTFPLGYFWHLSAFAEQYHRLALYRSEVIVPFGLLSMVLQGMLFAWVYPRLFNTGREQWAGNSLRFGSLFAVLAWSFTTLPVAAKYQMTSVSDFLLLETGFTALQFLVVSPLIALAYRDASVAALATGQST